ncbi:uncharacterized protein DUF563 [Alteromonadaceae bacterium 2753L.S.0a.02]|nr:uncharacterized protein DUF563 [Alteromonadaceae bacterium 2753L.S.0a.02]
MNKVLSCDVDSYTTGEQILFAAKSFLIDRIIPNVEKVILPPVTKPAGRVNFKITDSKVKLTYTAGGTINKLKLRFSDSLSIDDVYTVDFRVHSPENWSHALNLHLPFALKIKSFFGEFNESIQLLFIFPSETPNYIRAIFELFEINSIYESRPVYARCIEIDKHDWEHIQTGRSVWMEQFVSASDISKEILQEITKDARLPKRIFLARRKTRHILNEDEVFEVLEEKGFKKVYPEDLSPVDQIRLFMNAETVVAIHGAGLAPLIFAKGGCLKVIEIFSPGHMSEHFRTICYLNGVDWVGVRGVIEAKHVKLAYQNIKRFTKYSLDGFYVETESVKAALDYMGVAENN